MNKKPPHRCIWCAEKPTRYDKYHCSRKCWEEDYENRKKEREYGATKNPQK